MRRQSLFVLGLLLVGLLAVKVPAGSAAELTTPKDKTSYAIGIDMARSIERMGLDLNPDALLQGARDAFSGGKLLLSDEEFRQIMEALRADLQQKHAQALLKAAAENRQAGEAFLAANKSKEGVVTLPDGLQYKILKAGTGKKPTATDTVEFNYRGTLIDGREFDSSYRRGQPTTLKVGGLTPGWAEALQLMPVGSKWQLFIPANLAYGSRGMGNVIGPNSVLIFEVELLAIK